MMEYPVIDFGGNFEVFPHATIQGEYQDVMIVAMNPGQKTSAPSNPSASTSKAAASAGSTEPPRRHLA